MSQLFVSPFNEDVEVVRKEHREARKSRDADRIESVHFLNELIKLNILPDSLNQKAENLLVSHRNTEQKSQNLHNELTALKKSKRVNGFKNMNLFLANVGNPIFILVTGILFMILFIFRYKIDWINLAKSFFYLSLMYLFVASVYLYWALTPEREIDFVYYLCGIFLGAICATLGLKQLLLYLFKVNSIEEEKLLKAIRILFKQLLHTVPKKNFVKEEKFVEYTQSNNKIINKVTETIE